MEFALLAIVIAFASYLILWDSESKQSQYKFYRSLLYQLTFWVCAIFIIFFNLNNVAKNIIMLSLIAIISITEKMAIARGY